MKIADVITYLDSIAPPAYQESYDNAGLLTGDANWECTGIICSLDATEEVIREALKKKCNLIVAHHPIIFGGLKKINGRNYVERTVILAIKNDVAIFAIHTNLDNVQDGVNGRMADKLGLVNRTILAPKPSTLRKLFTFVPVEHIDKVRQAIFDAGAGNIGNYSECSFVVEGTGSFMGKAGTDPYVGQPGKRHYEKELKLEVIFPGHILARVIAALKAAHPYEEVAFDVVDLVNAHPGTGSGMIGRLVQPMEEQAFLSFVKEAFGLKLIKHTRLSGKKLSNIAICGGAGSFLISKALAKEADAFVTADMKYHEYFDADGKMLICDIGHYESEQFTTELLADILHRKFPTFAVLKSDTQTNPVHYYF